MGCPPPACLYEVGFRDFVVIARSLEDYQGSSGKMCFARYDIPYFMDQRIQVQYMPLMNLVTSLVDGKRGIFSTGGHVASQKLPFGGGF